MRYWRRTEMPHAYAQLNIMVPLKWSIGNYTGVNGGSFCSFLMLSKMDGAFSVPGSSLPWNQWSETMTAMADRAWQCGVSFHSLTPVSDNVTFNNLSRANPDKWHSSGWQELLGEGLFSKLETSGSNQTSAVMMLWTFILWNKTWNERDSSPKNACPNLYDFCG